MKTNEIITEARRDKVILVDFQPAYQNWYTKELSNACEYINKRNPYILAFYNGMDVGIYDTEDEVYEHYLDHGLNPNANIEFREKGYAFLRGWMDNGASSNAIIKMIRTIVTDGSLGSDDYTVSNLQEILGADYRDFMAYDILYIPGFAIDELKTFSGALIGGGGRDECLREIELLMSAFNIRYKRVQEWIYG